jgi:phosphate-selective porin OprO/OprP
MPARRILQVVRHRRARCAPDALAQEAPRARVAGQTDPMSASPGAGAWAQLGRFEEGREPLMRAKRWRKAAGVLIVGVVAVMLAVGPAAAEDPTLQELKARLDRLEKQNEELKRKLEVAPAAYQPAPYTPAPEPDKEKKEKEKINKMVDSYLKEKDAKKKKEDDAKALQKEQEGYKVGSITDLKARWNLDQGIILETPNRDFWAHLGLYFQWDTVSFTQSKPLIPATQLGRLTDGTFFRRIRTSWDGQAWGFCEWNFILALEQLGDISAFNGNGNGQGLINLDEVWAGVYGLPIIGRIRAGHMKVPQGLEGNQFSSSRAMTFQENAAYTDAFYTIFGTGVCILNSALDDGNGDRVTWQAMVYRDDFSNDDLNFANTGAFFGDGEFSYTGRITGLVFADCQDHHLLHLGLSYTHRDAENVQGAPGFSTVGPPMVRFRARPELRDAIGGFGDNVSLPGNSGRLIDTGALVARGANVAGTELFYIRGPFSVMAEWAFAQAEDAQVPVTVRGRTANVVGNRNFNGGYITVSYFLTGETRTYDRTYGREGTFYVERPFTNAYFKRGEDGSWLYGLGAWEVAARYSYVNLNDGPVNGGIFSGWTVGLNWYLSSNLKVQFEYLFNERYDKLSTGTTGGSNGNISGNVQGFGTRMQFQF